MTGSVRGSEPSPRGALPEKGDGAYLETLIDTTPVGPALLRGPTCPFQRVK